MIPETATQVQELQLAVPLNALDPAAPEVSTVRSWIEAEAGAAGISIRPIPPFEWAEVIGGQAWDIGRNLLADCPVEWKVRVAHLPTDPSLVVVEILTTEAGVHLSDTFLEPLSRVAEEQGLSPVVSRNQGVGPRTVKDVERLLEGEVQAQDTLPAAPRPAWSLETVWGLRAVVAVDALSPGLLAGTVSLLVDAMRAADAAIGPRPATAPTAAE